MNKNKVRQILEEELLYPSRSHRYEDEGGEYPGRDGVRQGRSMSEIREKFRSDGRRVFGAIDRAYKIPDQICKGINDFYKSFGETLGNKSSASTKKRRKR